MNNSKILIALGYPLGIVKLENSIVYEIDLYNKLFLMDASSYFVWKLCFNVVRMDEFFETTKKKIPNYNLKNDIDRLISEGLILCLDIQNSELIYKELRNYIIVRQGTGIGINASDLNYYIKVENDIAVSENDYSVWIQVDGEKSIGEIIEDFNSSYEMDFTKSQQSILESVLFLYSRGLIFFVGIKQ